MLSRYFWSYLCSNIDILKYFQSFRPVIWYYFGTRSLLCPTASRREWRSDSCCGSARCTNFVVLSTVHDTVADGEWHPTRTCYTHVVFLRCHVMRIDSYLTSAIGVVHCDLHALHSDAGVRYIHLYKL